MLHRLFIFDELYLPQANAAPGDAAQRNQGQARETFQHPDRKWIFGEQHPGRPNRIYYYEYFDSDIDTFGNISVFEFDPGSFTDPERIFASTAHWEPNLNTWVFEDGWERTFNGSNSYLRGFPRQNLPRNLRAARLLQKRSAPIAQR